MTNPSHPLDEARRPAVVDDTAWMIDALCTQTDPEAFYPEKGQSPAPAKAVCAACTVTAECLAYALAHDERFGVWGGTTDNERRELRRELRSQRAVGSGRTVRAVRPGEGGYPVLELPGAPGGGEAA